MQDANMVFIEGVDNPHEFYEGHLAVQKNLNNANNYHKYLIPQWQNITEEEKNLGHGGMDYFMLQEFLKFLNCAIEGKEMPIDVYDAASWACITALSEQSIAHGGCRRRCLILRVAVG